MERIKSKFKLLLKVLFWLILGMILGALSLFAYNYYLAINDSNVSNTISQTQLKNLLSKVSKLTILPTGEDPAVATISDAPSLIKEQPFYKNTINGDIVLVYQKASKAIVYSPSRNLIVNIGPVFLQDNTPVATTTATSTGKK